VNIKTKLLFIFCLLNLSFSIQATRFDITATIGQIRYHEASNTLATSWKGHTWFSLANPNKSPNCDKYDGEYMVSVPDGNETAIAMILAAKMSGSQVLITIDDAVDFPSTGRCKLQYLTIK
jgi:hypothetical protein